MLTETNNPICLECKFMHQGDDYDPQQPDIKTPLLFCLYNVLSQPILGGQGEKPP